jgi:hypothetical protein
MQKVQQTWLSADDKRFTPIFFPFLHATFMSSFPRMKSGAIRCLTLLAARTCLLEFLFLGFIFRSNFTHLFANATCAASVSETRERKVKLCKLLCVNKAGTKSEIPRIFAFLNKFCVVLDDKHTSEHEA